MSLLGGLLRGFGSKPDAARVQALLEERATSLDDVTDVGLSFAYQANGGGAVSGRWTTTGTASFGTTLKTLYVVLHEALGDRADRVTFYVSAVTPGGSITPADLGLSQSPVGREIARDLPEDTGSV